MKTKWRVKFMRKGWEPPYPFGRSEEIVEALSRREAIPTTKSVKIISAANAATSGLRSN